MKLPKTFVPEKDSEGNIERLLKEEIKPKYGNLDANPLLNSDSKPVSQNQDRHIVQFNSLGKVMASLADYYEAGKSGSKALINSLGKDFSEEWIVGSDRIVYSGDSLDAKIVHYFGSTVIEPVEVGVFIPDYSNGETLDTVLDDEHGLAYIQALFSTADDKIEIKDTLSALNGKASNKILVWTPNQDGRKGTPDRVAFLGVAFLNHDSGFRVDCINNLVLDSSGRSRGVRFSSR